jgi:hypothetical protein
MESSPALSGAAGIYHNASYVKFPEMKKKSSR